MTHHLRQSAAFQDLNSLITNASSGRTKHPAENLFAMKNTLFLLLMCWWGIAHAQTDADALRFSYLKPGGTARLMGVGGAFNALGADFGALSQNPAGIALYRTNEFVLTPSLRFQSTDAALPGEPSLRDERTQFNMDNAGVIFHSRPRAGKWTTINVGLGYNRTADFYQSIFYDGYGDGTITNGYFEEANAVFNSGGDETGLDPFGSRLAWDANAIYPDLYDNLSYDFINDPSARIRRNQSLSTRGGINEMLLSFGGNYDEKLMLGVTFGVPILRYRLESVYTESDPDDAVPFFDDLQQTEYVNTDGVGFNVKFGMIYHFNQTLRLGAAFHSPTWYGMTDEYGNTFAYSYTDGGGSVNGQTQFSPTGVFDYNLNTPWRAEVGAAAVIGKAGFISADVEWVDYGASRYNYDKNTPSADFAYQESLVNNDIRRNLRSVTNFRFGAEFAPDIFRLRGGAMLMGRPGSEDSGFDLGFTGGLGVRVEGFYVDLAYRNLQSDGALLAYSDAPTVSLTNRSNEFLLTIGFKF